MSIVFAPAAARDIEELSDYVHAENPPAALRLVAGLRARCDRILDAPRGGVLRPELSPGLRSVPFRRYVIFYTLEGSKVRIERILHGARDIEAIFGDEEAE